MTHRKTRNLQSLGRLLAVTGQDAGCLRRHERRMLRPRRVAHLWLPGLVIARSKYSQAGRESSKAATRWVGEMTRYRASARCNMIVASYPGTHGTDECGITRPRRLVTNGGLRGIMLCMFLRCVHAGQGRYAGGQCHENPRQSKGSKAVRQPGRCLPTGAGTRMGGPKVVIPTVDAG
jgi:hypothetical protein